MNEFGLKKTPGTTALIHSSTSGNKKAVVEGCCLHKQGNIFTKIMMVILVQICCVLLAYTRSGDAQVIYDEPRNSNGFETSVYAKVKELLMSNIASGETKRNDYSCNIERLTEKISRNSEHISKLENELRIAKGNYSLSERNSVELFTDGKSNLTKQIVNLESKLRNTIKSSETLLNESFFKLDDRVAKLFSENDSKLKITMDKSDIKIAEIVQNISVSMLALENDLKINITSIQHDVTALENDFQEQLDKITNDSIRMNLQLKEDFDKHFYIYVKNKTNALQNIYEHVKMKEIEHNMTFLSLKQKLRDLEGDKATLSGEIMNAKTEMRNKVNELIAQNGLLMNDILNNVTNLMDDQQQNIVQDMYVIEKYTKQNFETQLETVSYNMSTRITDIEDLFFTRLEDLGFKNNRSTNQTLDLIKEFREEVNEKLNETSSQLKIVTAELENFFQRVTSVEKSQEQLGISTNSSLESIKIIAANISTINKTLTAMISSLDDDVALISRQCTSRLNDISGNISTLLNKTTNFELFHDSQNMRIVDIENRLSITTEASVNLFSDIIRLWNVYGNRTYGRVEVNYNGNWGTVCDDNWDDQDAKVACRMMGLRGGRAVIKAYYGRGTGFIWLDEMSCLGNELSLFACPHNTIGSHDCSHGEDAGVVCS